MTNKYLDDTGVTYLWSKVKDEVANGGKVKSVNNVAPNTSGNITLTASNVGAAASTHTHYNLVPEGDNRNVATVPNDYSNKLIFKGIKAKASINSPSTDTYSYLVGLRGWSDNSGGNAYELAFNDSGIFTRKGASTSWDDWQKILTSTSTLDGTKISGTIPAACYTDTKNTAGSTNTDSKIFLIGATSQGANPQTYSDSDTYVTNGTLRTGEMNISDKVTLKYNTTTESLDFVFN